MMTDDGSVPLVATLRRLMNPATDARAGTLCDLCGGQLAPAHAHVVDTHSRRLLCACQACAATDQRAADARYRRVPARYLHLPSISISDAHWEALAIPVGLAFFFFNAHLGRMVAFYPSPAGATESQLSLDAWATLEEGNPCIATMAPDVEALLVRRTTETYAGFIVPIDACYELVGRIRSRWAGLMGGEAVQNEINGFFATIEERSRPPALRERL